MESLGHSEISLTMSTYIHVMPAMQRDAAHRLDVLLTGTGGSYRAEHLQQLGTGGAEPMFAPPAFPASLRHSWG
jgi:hypothetical protein